MSFNETPEVLLENLFDSFDTNKMGYLGKSELRKLCKGISLTNDEFETIFKELDSDGDNKISKKDFVQGFAESHELFLQDGTLTPNSPIAKSFDFSVGRPPHRLGSIISDESVDEIIKRGPLNRQASWKKFTEEIGLDYYLLSQEGQEEVCEMYQKLADPTSMHLLENFESVVQSLVKELRKQECENERLETSFKREKEGHGRHLRQLEEELDNQVQKVEMRVRREEQDRYEQEKEELKKQFESDILQLQDNLKKLQKLEVPIQGDSDGMKNQLEELCQENRSLKRSLTDVQTTLALQRSELVTLRQSYEDKKRELDLEKNTLMDYIKEQESLTRQVLMLQDANKNLRDANDDIRATIDTSAPNTPVQGTERNNIYPAFMNFHSTPLSLGVKDMGQKSDYVREYLSSTESIPLSHLHKPNVKMNDCLAEELSKSTSARLRRVLPAQDSVEVEDLPEDFDSGHSTLQGIAEVEMEIDRQSNTSRHSSNISRHSCNSPEDVCIHRPRKKTRVIPSNAPIQMNTSYEDEYQCEHDDIMYLDQQRPRIEMTLESEEELERMRPTFSRANSTCSQCSEHSRNSYDRRSNDLRRKFMVPEFQPQISSTPERMYKVVLCGDAAVGKSSFIMRLSKNKFVNNLNSTLGVDFQTKTLVVDGRCIALQLWDTAGQERFRSIAKSYFRRADGVLLLYDCSYERSFMSVREWVDCIEDGAQKKIPIMLVGNKTDLRTNQEEHGTRCVKTDEGQRLAREFDAIFIETSAKSGSNIQEAALEFARLLKTNEDLEVKTVGMQLHDIKEKEKSSCC